MALITWILRDGASASPRFLSFAEKFAKEGYESRWANLTAVGKDITDWLVQNIPNETRHIFLCDKDPKWVRELALSVHSLPIQPDRTYAVFYAVDDAEPASALQFLSTGIDQFIGLGEDLKDALPRLKLAEVTAKDRSALIQKMCDQRMNEAKTETIMKQREEFLSVCAHDLRSPLGLIQSNLSLLLTNSKSGLNDFQSELVTRAKRQAGQAITLVNDLLDVMSFEQGLKPQYEMLNIHSFLKEFHADYSAQAEQKGISVQYDNPVKDWRVLADADRIRQLLQNLFVNAVKFTEKDKKIYINVIPFTGRRKNDPPYPMIIVSIKDEGRGIPQKELQLIFDRFTQVKDAGRDQGRGLGLTVAKQISTLHDGNIWVQSVEGEGSTFFVLFPHVISRALPQGKADPKNKKKVVVTEVNVERREGLFELMGRWGYEPVFAKNGVEAITLAFHHLPELVILQSNLTKLDELQVSNILKLDPLTATIPVILGIETNPNPLEPQKPIDELAYDAVLKLPFTQESFLAAVGKASGKKIKPKKAA